MTDTDPRDPVDDLVDVAAGVDVWERRFRPGATLHVLGVSGDTDSAGQVSGDARAVSPTAEPAPGSPSLTFRGSAPVGSRFRCDNCRSWLSDHCKVHLIPCCPGKCPGLLSEPEHLARRYWVHHERMAWQFGYGPPEGALEWDDLPDARRRFLVAVFESVLRDVRT